MQIVIENGNTRYFMPHELEDTVGLMCSENFIDRMVAEYFQLRIRLWVSTNLLIMNIPKK